MAARLESILPPILEEGRGSGGSGGGDGGGGGGDGGGGGAGASVGVIEEYRRARRAAVARWMEASQKSRDDAAVPILESSSLRAPKWPSAGAPAVY